jgi:hypothetical protein
VLERKETMEIIGGVAFLLMLFVMFAKSDEQVDS